MKNEGQVLFQKKMSFSSRIILDFHTDLSYLLLRSIYLSYCDQSFYFFLVF
jgi:hypothetical protein